MNSPEQDLYRLYNIEDKHGFVVDSEDKYQVLMERLAEITHEIYMENVGDYCEVEERVTEDGEEYTYVNLKKPVWVCWTLVELGDG